MAETKKYVRIKKATYGSAWYAGKIGKVFEVKLESKTTYEVDYVEIRSGAYVSKEDAELLVTEKRPAEVGERVLITNAASLEGQPYENGDVFVVESTIDLLLGDVRVLGVLEFIEYSEYEVIVNNEVKNEEADGMGSVNKTAIDSASTVFEKVGEDYIGSKSRFGDILIGAPYSEAFVKAYANERKDVLVIPKTIEYTAVLHGEEMKKIAKGGQEAIKERAQARRDEIVEQAKADVEKLTNYGDVVRYETDVLTKACNVEFVVDRDKRTVVALLKGVRTGNVYAKGIAKAAPDDCFNVHIGKAIALRRALGLAVPDEYLNAPQPTEVRVGDVISWTAFKGEVYEITKKSGSTYDFTRIKSGVKYNGLSYENVLSSATIIDDSREEVGE
ncbi:hypothetical protein [Bacillus nakamurai]|uniref:hypothetical protein n=1 Tax=Bacillus nakamurai TaxID=1793963 RepID=UPI0020C4B9EE|nr:hypothetical protein [Bacillus nakamurai]MCP6682935.1 hypothetical protein [Bacillus nakamurai]